MPPPVLSLHLPAVTPDLPGVGGSLRLSPESFIVEEVPLYEASGEGTHLYVRITRENQTTRDLQLALESLFGLPRGSVGFAGLKDKAARTTQTFSIPTRAMDPALAAGVAAEMAARIAGALPVTVESAKFHTNKLKIGHLLGNRFQIAIHDVTPSLEREPGVALDRARAVCERLRATGLPNYFGPQRFGGGGDNALAGWEILTGQRRVGDSWLRKLLISAYQSHLCNVYLARRVEGGWFSRIMRGDVAKKHATGGIFLVEDATVEQPRFDAGEISYTAPIFGSKMRRSAYESAELENGVEAETGITDVQWRRAHTEGTRRMGRLLIPDLAVIEDGPRLICRFFLPKGGFATTVLAEIMKQTAVSLPEEDGDEEG